MFLYLQHAGSIVFLACRNVVAADAVNVAELACSQFGGNALVADEVMLGKAVLRHGDNRGGGRWCSPPFRGTSFPVAHHYIYAFEVAVALDDTLAAACTCIGWSCHCPTNHQAVVLVPIHSPLGVQTVVLHLRGIAVGIVGVMLMPYLRWGAVGWLLSSYLG